jgi:hypothetical protein
MIDTATSAGAEIRRLGLPAVFGAIMDGTLAENPTAPGYIRREFRRPHGYFGLCHDLVRHVPGLAGLCPLWEQNGEAVIGRLADGRFVRFHYEDARLEDHPSAAIEVLGKNYQQFVTSILLEFADAGLFDEYAQRLADQLDYQHLATLSDLLRDWTDENGEVQLTHFRDSLT